MRTCGGDGLTTDGVWSGIEPSCESELKTMCSVRLKSAHHTTTYIQRVYSTSLNKLMCACFALAAVVCTDLSAIDNGQAMYSPDPSSPYDYGTVATYVCNDGFGLVGRATRQ